MDSAAKQFLIYLRAVRNASPHTIRSYDNDLRQFLTFLTPPGTAMPPPRDITHLMIREFVAHLHDLRLEKSSIARKLAAIRSFFKFAVREGMIVRNPARTSATRRPSTRATNGRVLPSSCRMIRRRSRPAAGLSRTPGCQLSGVPAAGSG